MVGFLHCADDDGVVALLWTGLNSVEVVLSLPPLSVSTLSTGQHVDSNLTTLDALQVVEHVRLAKEALSDCFDDGSVETAR